MKKGKRTCEVLKDVRRRVAQENDIPLTEHECTYEGECRGTCPYCESEVRYLEQELQRRLSLGKAITVAGIAVSSLVMSGCHNPESVLEGDPLEGDVLAPESTEEVSTLQNTEGTEDPEVPAPSQSDTYAVLGIMEGTDKVESPASKCASKLASVDTDVIVNDEMEGLIIDYPESYADVPKCEWSPNIIGTPAQYLKERLTAFPASLRDPKYHNAYIVLILNEKGEVKDVVFQPREKSPSPEVQRFYEESTRILKAMPQWKGGHNAASYEIPLRNLW